jgi:hypothetical protein
MAGQQGRELQEQDETKQRMQRAQASRKPTTEAGRQKKQSKM